MKQLFNIATLDLIGSSPPDDVADQAAAGDGF
jgi:hypothetical protein